MQDIKISFYSKCNKPEEQKQTTLKKAIEFIKSDKLKKHIENLRNEPNKAKRQQYKFDNLPCLIFQGLFGYRNNENLIKPSGMAIMDIDAYDTDLKPIFEQLKENPHIVAIFKSPSGGLKFVVRIPLVENDKKYKIVYDQLLEAYSIYSPKTDISNKDIARLCFFSYDKDIYVNYDAKEFIVDWNKKKEEKQSLITQNKERDESGSGFDYRDCIRLIGKYFDLGDCQNRVFKEMNRLEHWKNEHDQYKIFTYDKAYKYVLENRKEKKKETQEIEIFNVSETLEKGIPEISYDIDMILREGGLTYIAGEPGTKKTFLAILMSMCIAKGKLLFNKFEVKKKRVCYIDCENGQIVLLNRYKNLILGEFQDNHTDIDKIDYLAFPDLKLDLDTAEEQIGEIIEKTGAEIIILDSLVRLMEGEEDKSKDVRKVFDNLKKFMAQGKSFIILHHVGKASNNQGMNKLRGSSDLGGMAEIILLLRNEGEYTKVSIAKHRHLGLDAFEPFSFKLEKPFGENSNPIKLTHFERSPEEKNKLQECYQDLIQWIDQNYKTGEIFRSQKALKEMDKLGGHSRNIFYLSIIKLKNDKIIKRGDVQGKWEVC